jgi:hypothetical protein
MRHFDEAAVIDLLDLNELNRAVEAAFADLGHGRAASTIRVRAPIVVADSAEGARYECGDLIRAVDAGTFDWDRLVEISDVLAGSVDAPRAGDRGPVVFESEGTALQDVVAAALVWRRASTMVADPVRQSKTHENVPLRRSTR